MQIIVKTLTGRKQTFDFELGTKVKAVKEQLQEKELQMALEAKILKKREKQARMLEQKEAEILGRLKLTQLQRKEVINDIEHLMRSTGPARQQSPPQQLTGANENNSMKFNASLMTNLGVLSHDTIIGP